MFGKSIEKRLLGVSLRINKEKEDLLVAEGEGRPEEDHRFVRRGGPLAEARFGRGGGRRQQRPASLPQSERARGCPGTGEGTSDEA